MATYQGDPRWIEVRYPTRCRSCGEPIASGERALHWPGARRRRATFHCPLCGEPLYRRFLVEAAEEGVGAGGDPYAA